MSARTVWSVVGWLSAIALFGCGAPSAPPGDAERDGGAAAVPDALPGSATPSSLPFDLDAIVDRVRSAYRPSEASGRFEGGLATYAVAADARSIELRAFHAPGERAQESEALALEAEVARGGRVLAARGVGLAEVAEDGHLTIARGAFVEHLRNGEDGVEQSWSFAERPSGSGDLTVRIAVRGMRHVGNTETGVHLADASGLGFRYGHGTWIDATGARTAVPVRWAEGAIELRVPAAVVEGAGYPAVLDPIISPEFGIDEPVMRAWGFQSIPSVASNGSDYLVVWWDYRCNWGVCGTRVSAAGAVLDIGGLVLGVPSLSPERGHLAAPPRVASNGSDYLVVWAEWWSSYDVFVARGTRVSAAGVVLDPSNLSIGGAANTLGGPEVASDGTDYLVVWEDGGDVRGARVSAAGTVLDPSPLAISTAAGEQSSANVASNGTDYLVVWQDDRSGAPDVYGARVSAAGAVLADVPVSTATGDQIAPRVASNGTDYLVVWQDVESGASAIASARVSATGTLLGESSLVSADWSSAPSVASDGSDYLVVWQDARNRGHDVYGARVSASGTVDGDLVLATGAGVQWRPMVASNGTEYLVVWEHPDSTDWGDEVFGTRVSAAGAVEGEDAILLSIMTNSPSRPSVAWNGTDYLAVWLDLRGVLATRVSAAGTVLDPSGIAIAPLPTSGLLTNARAASNGTDYLVVWEEGRDRATWDVRGARVSAIGTVLDEGGLAISTAPRTEGSARVASNGTDYLVVWEDRRSITHLDVYGARVSAAGTVLEPSGLAISTAARNQYTPNVASNGTDYLVVWHDQRGASHATYAARVSAAGAVLDETGFAVSVAASNPLAPSVASNGADYLVVWQDVRSSAGQDVYGAWVSASGMVQGESDLAISTASENQGSPSVAANGPDYLVVWQDFRNRSYPEIYGTRVRAGAIESPVGIVFAAGRSLMGDAPALAAGPPGQFLLAYRRSVPEASYTRPRFQARLVQYHEALGEACRADAQCESGHCVDGVCCDGACGGGAVDDCQACSVAAGAAVDGTCGPTSGNACDDGASCTTSDVCAAGVCEGSGDRCRSGTTCTEAGGGYACSACPAGTSSADGSGATACVECAVGTWSGIGATSCAGWSTCSAGEYESAAPSSARDRECRPCTVCGPGEVASAPCSASADTVCAAIPDAGMSDGGARDAGARDAGARDGGELDAGTVDSGALDAGVADAGLVIGVGGGGCGCAAAGSGASSRSALALFGLGLALVLQRRRAAAG